MSCWTKAALAWLGAIALSGSLIVGLVWLEFGALGDPLIVLKQDR